MQIVDNLPASKKTSGFKIVSEVPVETTSLNKHEKQKLRNERINNLINEYNELCEETKGRKLTENELIKARTLLMELKGLSAFSKRQML